MWHNVPCCLQLGRGSLERMLSLVRRRTDEAIGRLRRDASHRKDESRQRRAVCARKAGSGQAVQAGSLPGMARRRMVAGNPGQSSRRTAT